MQIDPFYQRAAFLSAADGPHQAPDDSGLEVAFAGRSNAGKSSAINALCHQRQLARTSKTPGRTQQLIFFSLDEQRRIVDLPGYGYAKVSDRIKYQWQRQMARYLETRESLAGLVIVMDIRRPLTDFDQQMLGWALAAELPVLLLLTKADKLKRGAIATARAKVQGAVKSLGGAIRVEIFSAADRTGVETVQRQLDEWLERDEPGNKPGNGS